MFRFPENCGCAILEAGEFPRLMKAPLLLNGEDCLSNADEGCGNFVAELEDIVEIGVADGTGLWPLTMGNLVARDAESLPRLKIDQLWPPGFADGWGKAVIV